MNQIFTSPLDQYCQLPLIMSPSPSPPRPFTSPEPCTPLIAFRFSALEVTGQSLVFVIFWFFGPINLQSNTWNGLLWNSRSCDETYVLAWVFALIHFFWIKSFHFITRSILSTLIIFLLSVPSSPIHITRLSSEEGGGEKKLGGGAGRAWNDEKKRRRRGRKRGGYRR